MLEVMQVMADIEPGESLEGSLTASTRSWIPLVLGKHEHRDPQA